MTDIERRVLITGANKGIGLATVAGVLAAGDDTAVLLGSRDTARGEAARSRLLERQPSWEARIAVVTIDVTDDDSVARAAASVAAQLGDTAARLYGLINNAGTGFPTGDMAHVLNVNTYGPKRVCDAFVPLLRAPAGRIVNVSSAAGPMFVASCSRQRQRQLTDPQVTWEQIDSLLRLGQTLSDGSGDFASEGLGDGRPYGLSKACLNAYTIALARRYPDLRVNCCTPGFIETDLTRPVIEARGRSPQEMGMRTPEDGASVVLHLLFSDPIATGWYFGSDAVRSPMDRYRSPGEPPYEGD